MSYDKKDTEAKQYAKEAAKRLLVIERKKKTKPLNG